MRAPLAVVFPLDKLRIYGIVNDYFKVETGSSSPTGEGHFLFSIQLIDSFKVLLNEKLSWNQRKRFKRVNDFDSILIPRIFEEFENYETLSRNRRFIDENKILPLDKTYSSRIQSNSSIVSKVNLYINDRPSFSDKIQAKFSSKNSSKESRGNDLNKSGNNPNNKSLHYAELYFSEIKYKKLQ